MSDLERRIRDLIEETIPISEHMEEYLQACREIEVNPSLGGLTPRKEARWELLTPMEQDVYNRVAEHMAAEREGRQ